ncbi:hypothetical protein [Tenacibaculum sp. SDUM215027]|uniref:hypothetical protein n=1 Tax=Tenacibaculum sp. SDUM215027 TaxID=3422596 RepID=UPI003D319A48
MILILGIIIALVGVYIFYLKFQRKTKVWSEEIEVANDIKIPIEFMSSQRKYYGGHGFGWGGGDDRSSIKFDYNSISYSHKGSYFLPYVIKLFKDNFYVVSFDRTNMSKIIFRFFKSDKKGSFKEIKAEEFPKHLAVQNRKLKDTAVYYGDETKEMMKTLNPDEIKNTLTAKMWFQLERGTNYYEMPSDISLDFLKSYKEKYLNE